VDIILVERPTPRSSGLPSPMLTRAMSIPTERTQYSPLRSLYARPRSTFMHIITGTHPNRALHTWQLSLAPPNDRVNLTHTGFTLLPYARYFRLRSLRDTSFRVLLLAFSLTLAFVFPATPLSQIVSLVVSVDDADLHNLNVNRTHHHCTICQ
jgi:hypothetical protein